MQSQDALIAGSDLSSDRAVLPRQHIENAADGWGHPDIRTIRDDPEQLPRSIAAVALAQPAEHRRPQHRKLSIRALRSSQKSGKSLCFTLAHGLSGESRFKATRGGVYAPRPEAGA
jgi:hypothetical protein